MLYVFREHEYLLRSVLCAVALGFLIWIINAAVLSIVFHRGTFEERILYPAAYSISTLIIITLAVFAFSILSYLGMAKHQQAETALKLKSEKEKWESTFDTITDPLFTHDSELKIIMANKAYQEAAGMPLSEIIGKPYYEVFPKMDGPFNGCLKALKLQEEKEEEEVLTPDGKIYKMRFYPIKTGTRKHSIHLLEDITDLKKVEEEKAKLEIQLRQTSKMEAIGQLAGGIAHDFNNMLNAIMGFGSLLKMDIDKDSPLMSHVKQILDAAERAAMITHQLLAFSRKQMLDIKPVNINDIIKSIISVWLITE